MSYWDVHFLIGVLITLALTRNMWFSIAGGFYSVVLDFDHIWMYTLHTDDPIILPNIIFQNLAQAGRPFHTVYMFLAYAAIIALCTPLPTRQRVMIFVTLVTLGIVHLWLDTFNPLFIMGVII